MVFYLARTDLGRCLGAEAALQMFTISKLEAIVQVQLQHMYLRNNVKLLPAVLVFSFG